MLKNADFETGVTTSTNTTTTPSRWSGSGTTGVMNCAYMQSSTGASCLDSGSTYLATLLQSSALSQTVSVTAGYMYAVSFDARYDSRCPSPSFTAVGSACYSSSAGPTVTFDQAATNCASIRGKIAYPTDATSNTNLRNYANSLYGSGVRIWLGINDKATPLQWVDNTFGTTPSYYSWYPGEPNNAGGSERCAELYTSDRWNDIGCGNTRSYVCQMDMTPSPAIAVTMGADTFSSSVALTTTMTRYSFSFVASVTNSTAQFMLQSVCSRYCSIDIDNIVLVGPSESDSSNADVNADADAEHMPSNVVMLMAYLVQICDKLVRPCHLIYVSVCEYVYLHSFSEFVYVASAIPR